jgi:RsiW-degrading membrane proteinase PrsW (M82 family)
MNDFLIALALSLIAGLLPALLWLWFWLHEDKKHPEPRSMVSLAFLGGMTAVLAAIPLEQSMVSQFNSQTQLIVVWAAIEELLKFAAALIIVLRSKANDEPLDSVIYMMCTALGFAALENALFIFTPLYHGQATATIFTINLRFIGATLLHTLTCSVIGLSLAFTFYKSRGVKIIAGIIGIVLAIVLHSWFNLSIIQDNSNGILFIFSLVWLAIVVLILMLERVKKIVHITK